MTQMRNGQVRIAAGTCLALISVSVLMGCRPQFSASARGMHSKNNKKRRDVRTIFRRKFNMLSILLNITTHLPTVVKRENTVNCHCCDIK
jgi:hypothetical protein